MSKGSKQRNMSPAAAGAMMERVRILAQQLNARDQQVTALSEGLGAILAPVRSLRKHVEEATAAKRLGTYKVSNDPVVATFIQQLFDVTEMFTHPKPPEERPEPVAEPEAAVDPAEATPADGDGDCSDECPAEDTHDHEDGTRVIVDEDPAAKE